MRGGDLRIAMTPFARRSWEPGVSGTRIEGVTPDDVVAAARAAAAAGAPTVAGYAPFCRHLFIANHSPTRCSFAPITEANRHLLRSGYRSRRDGERAVLERWFEGVEAPVARYLDLILYNYDQLLAEAAEFPDDEPLPDCDWGIVSIIATMDAEEPPMPPATQVRNALGRAEGGSGKALDPGQYDAAVAFWEQHAAIR